MYFTDKLVIAKFLKKYLTELTLDEIESILEIPPAEINYTYAFPCFKLAKLRKMAPQKIAEELAKSMIIPPFLDEIKAIGPYLNFRISTRVLLKNIFKQKENFGRIRDLEQGNKKKSLRIVIEYPSPNTNKPLHLGHVRNMLLGSSLSNLLKYKGHQVFQVNLNNDRGIHICKSMLAYLKWGNGKEPNKKPDHFVGDFYVKYNQMQKKNPSLEQEARELLKKWEQGDPEVLSLWRKLNDWALEGFKETYKKLGVSFDKEYFESEIYKKGKEIVLEGLNKGIFEKTEDGAIIARLKERYGLEDKILIRSDGTSIYITQDIYLAYLKKKDFNYDKSIYVVGDEQIDHFKRLFAILDMMGFHENNYHLAYGMIRLPEGKMKSREGTVVDADDIIAEMENLALKEVDERYPEIDENEKSRRARIIGLAALKFFILKFSPIKGFVFNPKESISFEGETGPYTQYCYARIESIIQKSGRKIDLDVDWNLLKHEKEIQLIKQLNYFPEILDDIENSYNIHLIPQYLLNLCQAFNSFYSSCKVISKDKKLEDARLLLIKCVQIIIKTGLEILGIETLEQM